MREEEKKKLEEKKREEAKLKEQQRLEEEKLKVTYQISQLSPNWEEKYLETDLLLNVRVLAN